MLVDDLISVIVPAYNVERFVRSTLESIMQQIHRRLEVIVVDDGSNDGTAAVVSALIKRDPRIRLIQTEHRGVSAARNLAIAQARGDLIAPIDADDLWHPEKLSRQLAVMQSAGPDVGVVYCWSAGIDENNRVILPAWNNSVATGNVLHAIVVRGIAGNGSTALIRRRFIEIVGGYDESLALCEDWKFYTILAGVCEFAVVPAYLTGYRLRPNSASMNVRAMEKTLADLTAWISKEWPDLPDDVLQDRKHVVNAYLAALAIRNRCFLDALEYLRKALRARPSKLFAVSYYRLFFMLLAHSVGLRVYRWDFWKAPDFTEFCKLQSSAHHPT